MTISTKPDLVDFIRSRIAATGPITMAQFMEWALYHPQHGYYMTGPSIGPRGDFTTSPEASPAFGRLLARHVAEVDALLEHPATFDIVECGPGRGTLAVQILDHLKAEYPTIYERATYWLVEISPALRQMQKDLLTPTHASKCSWVRRLENIPHDLEGALLANEFIDAFPVHVIENEDGTLREQYVENAEPGGFNITLGEPSNLALVEFLTKYNIELRPGERIEVNLAMRDWLLSLGRKLRRGVATLFDYGDTSPARYSEARKQGTLLGYFGGAVTHDVTARPGKQDLTALVDFTTLKDTAEEAGLTEIAQTRQAHFLLGLGLGTTETAESFAGHTADVSALLDYRRGIQALVSMEGLGRFHVSLLAKGVDQHVARNSLAALRYVDLQ
jgi:SAM-dependent MidA family methyltransferase